MAITTNGRFGYGNVNENTVLSFQVGNDSLGDMLTPSRRAQLSDQREGVISQVEGYNVLTRGANNRQIAEVSRDIKSNRLIPEVIEKKIKILYGQGLYVYRNEFSDDGRLVRHWQTNAEIEEWLNSWNAAGLTEDCNDFIQSCIRRLSYFEDFFVKWRFLRSKAVGGRVVAGLEMVENSRVRLASDKRISPFGDYIYDDFTHAMIGNWHCGSRYQVYPLFRVNNARKYDVAISHHAIDDVDSMYGRNKFYEGLREWIRISNDNPRFLRSFLRNVMAAKVHVIIPNEWVESKRKQIEALCNTNRQRKSEGKSLLLFNGIEIGDKFDESLLIKYTNNELERLTTYLSGAENQGKMFSSFSFKDTKGNDHRWEIIQIDLKYKEYIESLISLDQRADAVIPSGLGLDPSISNVSKEGVISKSGSDAYYNYIIYQDQLYATEKICCDPLNMAVMINFPHLWKQGLRIGLYRNTPARQQDVSPNDRMNA